MVKNGVRQDLEANNVRVILVVSIIIYFISTWNIDRKTSTLRQMIDLHLAKQKDRFSHLMTVISLYAVHNFQRSCHIFYYF